jgi:type IV pilus assembly protein PilM
MANSNAVWGIDIGQTALKALRCRPHDKEPRRIVAEAFDYIEYPKILSQPEADRTELIADALSQFVNRNTFKGDRVAVSVPGQTGLARFIKLPPVESKKIPDIVKYEARQQIPFSLDDVIWDYQQLAGGSEADGYVLETEVGLFAMKRDQVARSLEPLENAGLSVHYIQLAPLAIYNFACFDRLPELDPKEYDPESPPQSIVIISLGTDTTDLVITNGFRVWQRNIPIGGNHFTKSLSKELKLTFTKAEHLKRHATEAEDPKAVFQAMRPVFSDLLAEVQRSIGYFTSIDKKAKIGQILALGNAMKLPGLLRYLSQNLDQEVQAVNQFNNLVSGSVTAGPQFKENILGFAVPYGLCIQGLGKAEIHTNLLPEEIVTRRLVKEKKPWAVAAAAALLVGTTVNYVAHYSQWESADAEKPAIKNAITQANASSSKASGYKTEQSEIREKFEAIQTIGKNLVSNNEGRLLWLELTKAVHEALPKPEPPKEDDGGELTAAKLQEEISKRKELHITKIDCQQFPDLATWFAPLQKRYEADIRGLETAAADIQVEAPKTPPAAEAPANGAAAAPAANVAGQPTAPAANVAGQPTEPAANVNTTAPPVSTEPAPPAAPPDAAAAEAVPGDPASVDPAAAAAEGGGELAGPTGAGWVIELQGHHYHNGERGNETGAFVRKEFLKNLREGFVDLPNPAMPGGVERVSMADLGISHPILVYDAKPEDVIYPLGDLDALYYSAPTVPGVGANANDANGEDKPPVVEPVKLKRYRFIVQFAWRPTTPSERIQKKIEQQQAVQQSL